MSALGHKQTRAVQNGMSALPPIATLIAAFRRVRSGPISMDRRSAIRHGVAVPRELLAGVLKVGRNIRQSVRNRAVPHASEMPHMGGVDLRLGRIAGERVLQNEFSGENRVIVRLISGL